MSAISPRAADFHLHEQRPHMQKLCAFHGRILTTFQQLPAHGTLLEVAKRIMLVVAIAPLAYTILGLRALIEKLQSSPSADYCLQEATNNAMSRVPDDIISLWDNSIGSNRITSAKIIMNSDGRAFVTTLALQDGTKDQFSAEINNIVSSYRPIPAKQFKIQWMVFAQDNQTKFFAWFGRNNALENGGTHSSAFTVCKNVALIDVEQEFNRVLNENNMHYFQGVHFDQSTSTFFA